MKKNMAIGSTLLGIVFLAGCGQQLVSQTQPTTLAPIAQQPAPTVVPTDLQVYKNDKYGFEFQRSKKWELDTARTSASVVVFVNKKVESGESREAVSFKKTVKIFLLNKL